MNLVQCKLGTGAILRNVLRRIDEVQVVSRVDKRLALDQSVIVGDEGILHNRI